MYLMRPTLLLLLLLLLLCHSGLAGFQRVRITDQALLIHYSAKPFELCGTY